jgi:Effector Associated Constant Component 1
MTEQVAALALQVDAGADEDAEELAELTRQLRAELLQLDVEAVEPATAGEPPPGTRAVEALALGGLIVSLVKSAGMLASVVNAVRSWLGGGQRSVKLELDGDVLEVTGVSSHEQQALINAWIERHAARPAS